MNRNLLRGALYGLGFSLLIWALVLAFFIDWYWLLILAGAFLLGVAGFIDRDDDCGYSATPQGIDAARPRLTVIQGGRAL